MGSTQQVEERENQATSAGELKFVPGAIWKHPDYGYFVIGNGVRKTKIDKDFFGDFEPEDVKRFLPDMFARMLMFETWNDAANLNLANDYGSGWCLEKQLIDDGFEYVDMINNPEDVDF